MGLRRAGRYEGRCAGMNMEEEKGGQKRGKKRAAGEMWRNRQKCGWKILPCSLVGGPCCSNALSEKEQRRQTEMRRKGRGQGSARKGEGIEEKASMIKNNERKRGTGTATGSVPTTQPLRECCNQEATYTHTHTKIHTCMKTNPHSPMLFRNNFHQKRKKKPNFVFVAPLVSLLLSLHPVKNEITGLLPHRQNGTNSVGYCNSVTACRTQNVTKLFPDFRICIFLDLINVQN